ncbi:unnamed protein product [Cylicostephanus goldi]|uniref:Uncharacterized protein n=1 Tax=Cylicostephanus goldi TaxID=71465 RepID=A0A3P7LUD2_CYLGO|nr:unnamed protein product [Cylicostephanus goldi]
MRYFVCLLFLLLDLEVAVEARRWKLKPDMCHYMFVHPRMAHKQCNAACWKNKNCWGYCDEEHGHKRCVCGNCERVCPPPPTGQPETSPPAPTEPPATSPTAEVGHQIYITFYTDQTYEEGQGEFLNFAENIKEEVSVSQGLHPTKELFSF